MARHDELGFETEQEMEAWEAEQDEHAEEIKNIVLDYVEENEVPDQTAVFTLLQIDVSLQMSSYMMETEKPSVAGLKLELDRFGGDIADLIRDSKKGAAEFIESYRSVMGEGEEG